MYILLLSTVIVAVLAGPVFASTLKSTEPFPFPVAPELIFTQEALLTAVHGHPLPEVTLKFPLPAAAGKSFPVEDNANVHPLAWEMLNTSVLTVMVPFRAGPAFAATV